MKNDWNKIEAKVDNMPKEEFKEMMDVGRPKDDSAARFIHTVLEAAGGDNPDQRVLSDR